MRPLHARFQSRVSVTVFSVGVVLFVLGSVGITLDVVPAVPLSGPGLPFDLDLEFLGIVAGTGAVLGDRMRRRPRTAADQLGGDDARRNVYVTRPLLESLLELAGEYEPEALSVGLAVTPSDRLTGEPDVPDGSPVFTHRYLPERPNSVSSVFGMDLHTPPARTHGLFVTHPRSDLRLTKRDRLHAVVLVAVPPWDDESVAAFDRSGRRYSLRVVDAVPPDELLPEENQ